MILPIYTLGQPVLRKEAEEITPEYPGLKELIDNMFETMDKAEGVGLAAPQVGLPIRLFVIDLDCMAEDHPEYKGFRRVFINPEILETGGEEVSYEEGCLSLPGIHEAVKRMNRVHMTFYDENFQKHDEWIDGFQARVVQHEHDHLDGTVFIDRIPPLRRQLLKSKINALLKGKAHCEYKVKTVRR